MFHVNEYTLRLHKNATRLQKPTKEDVRSRGIVLPKVSSHRPLDDIFREQSHRFLLLNAPCMETWRERYEFECEGMTMKPTLKEWILRAVREVIAQKKAVSQMVLGIALGPGEKGHFYTMYWAYGGHFRIMARDMNKKTTFDCGVSPVYEVEGQKTEFYGYVDTIVRLNFDSFNTVLFKCQFWDSIIRQRGSNATVLEDECGFDRVKARNFLRASAMDDDPFIFPKDVSQLFYVNDPINQGWKLAVKVQHRSNLVVYKKAAVDCANSGEETLASPSRGTVARGSGEPSAQIHQRLMHRSELVAVEADDDAGERVDIGEDDEEGNREGDDENGEEIYSDEEEPRHTFLDTPLRLDQFPEEDELAEIESDGEMEDERLLPCLDSAYHFSEKVNS